MTTPASGPSRPSADLRVALSAELIAAMKRSDRVAVSVLRSALAAIANAEAVDQAQAGVRTAGAVEASVVGVGAADVARRDLPQDALRALVQGEVAALDSAASEYHCFGSHDEAERLLAQAAVLRAVVRGEPVPDFTRRWGSS